MARSRATPRVPGCPDSNSTTAEFGGFRARGVRPEEAQDGGRLQTARQGRPAGALIATEFGREAHTRGVSEGVDRSVSSSSVDDVRKNIHQRRHGRGWEEEECVCRIKEHHSKLTSQKRSVKTCNRTQEITKKGNFNA